MISRTTETRRPWAWIPSLYFAEGLPWTVVMLVSVVFFKRMGISNVDIALYTSWLYLPWVIKPFWSPLVDILRTKRFWIILMQITIGGALGGIALAIPLPEFFKWSLGFLWLLAFSSATHDIAVDGFYMLGLNQNQQTWFVGIRSTFYRLSIIFGQGLLIILAGYIESHTGLGKIEIQVNTSEPEYVIQQSIIEQPSILHVPESGEIRLRVYPEELSIPLKQPEPGQVEKILEEIRIWNSERKNLNELPSPAPIRYSHKDRDPAEPEGNLGFIFVSLSAAPLLDNQEIVVLMGRESGSRNIQLLTDGRMSFNSGNWNLPYIQVVQLDRSLTDMVSTVFEARAGNISLAWVTVFGILAGLFILFFIYHLIALPRPPSDQDNRERDSGMIIREFTNVFTSFFRKPGIAVSLLFILFYRFGEAQLVKIAPLFMLDTFEAGGLGLTTGQYGFIYGTLGFVLLTVGGILGGIVASRKGLKSWIIPMALAMKLPDIVYVYMATVQPDSYTLISICVAIEQFGYGFGFTAFMLYLIHLSEGRHKTAHYAIATGFMALGMMIPGMFSGFLQDLMGYRVFFIWILICTLPGLYLIKYLKIDPSFGKKTD